MMGWWGFGWPGIIVMLIFWIAVIALAVWLVSSVLFPQSPGAPRSQVGPPDSDSPEPALDALKKRYARGEISRDGYEKERASLVARLHSIVVAVAYAMGWRPDGGRQGDNEPRQSALDILKARYARGEISKAEYEAMRDNLTD